MRQVVYCSQPSKKALESAQRLYCVHPPCLATISISLSTLEWLLRLRQYAAQSGTAFSKRSLDRLFPALRALRTCGEKTASWARFG